MLAMSLYVKNLLTSDSMYIGFLSVGGVFSALKNEGAASFRYTFYALSHVPSQPRYMGFESMEGLVFALKSSP